MHEDPKNYGYGKMRDVGAYIMYRICSGTSEIEQCFWENNKEDQCFTAFTTTLIIGICFSSFERQGCDIPL
jgi:hypothetical protein